MLLLVYIQFAGTPGNKTLCIQQENRVSNASGIIWNDQEVNQQPVIRVLGKEFHIWNA
uniref:Uncharacterized protein n=1 Tax=Oryza brachyantha TaxID=4533 RepID=J3MNB2_ORYBR